MGDVFEGVVGQERALEILRAAIASERVHHAWIFHGPHGVGKRTTAQRFAEALLTPADQDACELSAAGAFSHPDFHMITKELARHSDNPQVRQRKLISIPKEVIEERLLTPAALAPTITARSLAKKVFVVDEAELLNLETQNALLKTLEEPPAGTVIVLVTSSEDRLLPTIRSRCQRIAFGLLDDASLRAWLERSGIDASPEDASWLVEFARGAPGLLEMAHEYGLAQWAGRLAPLLDAADQGRFDPTLGPTLAEMVEAWAEGWVERHKDQNPSKDAANKAGAARALDMVAERGRRVLWERPEDEAAVERAARIIELANQTHQRISANVNIRLAMENLASQLAR